jgi:serine/threonine protein kinase/formylglycine-generating enzyme required for sulfatase activity
MPTGPLVFDHFEVLTDELGAPVRLGPGGMGTTYRAFDTRLRKQVALKLISDQLLKDPTSRLRFFNEARAAALIEHPNVARVLYLCPENAPQYFFAMELVDGESLASRVARHGPLSPSEALQLLRPVADALTALGEHHLVHRDIKPENIMIARTGSQASRVKLIDFGLAKPMAAAAEDRFVSVDTGDRFIGSVYFASPEQIRSREPLDPRSDFYSLGATLWHVLTGFPPFTGTVFEVQEAHVYREPYWEKIAEAPRPISILLRRLLAKPREARPRDAYALLAEWDEAIAGLDEDRARASRPLPSAAAVAASPTLPATKIDGGTGKAAPAPPVPTSMPTMAAPASEERKDKTPADEQRAPRSPSASRNRRGRSDSRMLRVFVTVGACIVIAILALVVFSLVGVFKDDPAKRLAGTPAPTPPPVAATPAPIVEAPPPRVPVPPADPVELASKAEPFVNSLGLEFVPLPGHPVLIGRTPVRVGDFAAYAKANNIQATGGAVALKIDTKKKLSEFAFDPLASWQNPGFEQTEAEPVVCVNWFEARAFCEWLSMKEGRVYRLPSDDEWTAAAGPDRYPWGNDWPPPENAGNFLGSEVKASAPGPIVPIKGYADPFPRTSPVGAFPANRHGIFDLAGNVWQWCEDEYRAAMNDAEVLSALPVLKTEREADRIPFRVRRGVSWSGADEVNFRTNFHLGAHPANRNVNCGFRCVIVKESATATPVPVPPGPPGVATPPEQAALRERILRFVQEYIGASVDESVETAARYFAPTVDYLGEGKVDRAYIRHDVEAYHKRWPQQSQQLEGEPKITIAADGRLALVDYTLRYDVRNGPSYVKGRTNDRLTLDLTGNSPRISVMKSTVLERDKGGPPNPVAPPPAASSPVKLKPFR